MLQTRLKMRSLRKVSKKSLLLKVFSICFGMEEVHMEAVEPTCANLSLTMISSFRSN